MTSVRPAWCIDLGLMDFPRAHDLQLKILEARISEKIDRDVVLVLEHPPVFTMGRRGNREHLKVSPAFLTDVGMDIHHIERGGDITFHGPGQLVLYPIFNLRQAGFAVVDFVEMLEEVMLQTAGEMGVSASRDKRNHGVWVGNRKLGFVGIAVRRSVSFHGIALNVNLSLDPFTWIHPCGLQNVHVTSLDLEADRPVAIDGAKTVLMRHIEASFTLSFQYIDIHKLKDMIQ
jgi:lipoate-protein ligase B